MDLVANAALIWIAWWFDIDRRKVRVIVMSIIIIVRIWLKRSKRKDEDEKGRLTIPNTGLDLLLKAGWDPIERRRPEERFNVVPG